MRARVKFEMAARAHKVVIQCPVLASGIGLYHNQQATGPPIGGKPENFVVINLTPVRWYAVGHGQVLALSL